MYINEFLLREARPKRAYRCVMDGNRANLTPLDGEPAYDWLNHVIREGFAANAPNGPTYYRVAKTDELRYYSVFRDSRDGELVLLITDLEHCTN